jgi:hypothetical protein
MSKRPHHTTNEDLISRLNKQDEILMEQQRVQHHTDEKLQIILEILQGSSVHRTPGMRSVVDTMQMDLRTTTENNRDIKKDVESMKDSIKSFDSRLGKIEKGKTFTWDDIRTKIVGVMLAISTLLTISVAIKELLSK